MRHKDVLHTVNNQLEIITSAAELLSFGGPDASTRDLCTKIQSAVQATTAALSPHFKGLISREESASEPDRLTSPVTGKRALHSSPIAE
jgi:hypothetical protein